MHSYSSIHEAVEKCTLARVRHTEYANLKCLRVFGHIRLLQVQELLLGFYVCLIIDMQKTN